MYTVYGRCGRCVVYTDTCILHSALYPSFCRKKPHRIFRKLSLDNFPHSAIRKIPLPGICVASECASVIFVLFRLQGCGPWLHVGSPTHINLNLTLVLTLTLTILTLRPYCLNFPERTLPCIQSKEYQNHLRWMRGYRFGRWVGGTFSVTRKLHHSPVESKSNKTASLLCLVISISLFATTLRVPITALLQVFYNLFNLSSDKHTKQT